MSSPASLCGWVLFVLGLASLYHDPTLLLCLQARRWSPYAFHILESPGLVTLTTEMSCVCETFE